MSTAVGFTIWWVTGVLGTALLWRDYQKYMGLDTCPSPRSLCVWAVGGFAGLAVLFLGIAKTIATLLEGIKSPSWWTRPICGPRKRP